MPWAAAGAAVVGGYMSSEASKGAAKTQAGAADRATALTREQWEAQRADYAPFRETGYDALNLMRQSLGLAPVQSPTVVAQQQAQAAAAAGAGKTADQWRAELAPQFTQRMPNLMPSTGDSGDGGMGLYRQQVDEAGLGAEIQRRMQASQAAAAGAQPGAAVGEAAMLRGPQISTKAGTAPGGQPSMLTFQAPAQRVTQAQAPTATRLTSPQAAPTDAQTVLQMDPSYRFRLREGMDALEGGAAARGGALSGAAVKAGQRYAQDLASTEYGNAYGRMMQMAAREWDQGKYLDERDFSRDSLKWQQGQALDTADYNRAWDQNQALWGRVAGLAGVGQTATTNSAALGAGSASTMGSLITQGANAQAAGQVGQANAWGNAIGQAGQAYSQSRMLDLYTQRSPYATQPGGYTMGLGDYYRGATAPAYAGIDSM